MPDSFIDRLYDELVTRHAGDRRAPQTPADRDGPIQAWWTQFADALGQKVGAWNEKRPWAAPVHFTTFGIDRVRIDHTATDVEFRLEDNHVIARSAPSLADREDQQIFRLEVSDTGDVLAHSDHTPPLTTPAAAAEVVVEPILTRVFGDASAE